MSLYASFEKVLQACGLKSLTRPLAYSAPVALRFSIGDGNGLDPYAGRTEETINPAYVNACLDRAERLYSSLQAPPDLLVMEIALYDEDRPEEWISTVMAATDLPYPHETVSKPFCEDGDEGTYLYLCWRLQKGTPTKLLTEILTADLGTGRFFLTSCVFFVSTGNATLFHLYDDRGADLVANKADTLAHVYKEFHEWIPDDVRARIDVVFGDATEET